MSYPKKPSASAFTLIELLVVIAIVGLLSTLAAVALSSARTKSRDSKRAADLTQIQKSLEVSFVPTNGYPAVAAGGIILGATGVNPAGSKVLCAVAGVATFQGTSAGCGNIYMALVPEDPSSGDYTYKSTTAAGGSCTVAPCAGFCISTSLEDGLPKVGLNAGVIRADQASLKNGAGC